MNIQIGDVLRNRIYLCVVSIVVILLFINMIQASNQNQQYLTQYGLFQQVIQSCSQGDYNTTIELYQQLPPGYSDNFQALMTAAYAYAATNNETKARELLDQALENYPELQNDTQYLALYGNVLFLQKDYKNARIYLERCLEQSPDDATKKQIRDLMNRMP